MIHALRLQPHWCILSKTAAQCGCSGLLAGQQLWLLALAINTGRRYRSRRPLALPFRLEALFFSSATAWSLRTSFPKQCLLNTVETGHFPMKVATIETTVILKLLTLLHRGLHKALHTFLSRCRQPISFWLRSTLLCPVFHDVTVTSSILHTNLRCRQRWLLSFRPSGERQKQNNFLKTQRTCKAAPPALHARRIRPALG